MLSTRGRRPASTRPAPRRARPADDRWSRCRGSDIAASSNSAPRHPLEDVLRWGWVAMAASNAVWDNDGARAISARQVQLVREAGALAGLPLHLSALGIANAWIGDFAGAASNIAEADSVAAATGSRFFPWALLRLRALQGREAEASAAITSAIDQAAGGSLGAAIWAHWAAAVLYNGLARYEEAMASARQSTSNTFELWVSIWALPELVESAARAGSTELAREALDRLAETTQPCGTDDALGIEARCRALLSDSAIAEEPYRESIDRLSRTHLRPELARAHLLYGEWLRREGRRFDAREQLRMAHDMFAAIGMEAFAERARRELIATGENMRKRSDDTRDELTPLRQPFPSTAGCSRVPSADARRRRQDQGLSKRRILWYRLMWSRRPEGLFRPPRLPMKQDRLQR
jgi:tetratricopeptide (TPR) repeat protein